MALPWVRLDAHIYAHDKIVALLDERNGWKAYGLFTFCIAWSGGNGRDGYVPRHVIKMLHGDTKTMQVLVDLGFVDEVEGGWQIPNWGDRQELSSETDRKKREKRLAGIKSQCKQRHGQDCGCWMEVSNVQQAF